LELEFSGSVIENVVKELPWIILRDALQKEVTFSSKDIINESGAQRHYSG
jgi:hypothetical protein